MTTESWKVNLKKELAWFSSVDFDPDTLCRMLEFKVDSEFTLSASSSSSPSSKLEFRDALKLRSCLVAVNGCQSPDCTSLVDWLMELEGNLDPQVWSIVGTLGFHSKSLPPGLQYLRHKKEDIMNTPLFPGGGYFLEHNTEPLIPRMEEDKETETEHREFVSSSSSSWHDWRLVQTANSDGAGGVNVSLSFLSASRETLYRFLKNYVEGTLRHLWLRAGVFSTTSLTPKFSPHDTPLETSRLFKPHRDNSQNLISLVGSVIYSMASQERRVREVNRHLQTTPTTNHGDTFVTTTSSSTGVVLDIEDIEDLIINLPLCASNLVRTIEARGDHAKDRERLFLSGLLAGRVTRQTVIDLGTHLDLDGKGITEDNFRARQESSRGFITCKSVGEEGFCPYNNRGHGQNVNLVGQGLCQKQMTTFDNGLSVSSTPSPIRLLGMRKMMANMNINGDGEDHQHQQNKPSWDLHLLLPQE